VSYPFCSIYLFFLPPSDPSPPSFPPFSSFVIFKTFRALKFKTSSSVSSAKLFFPLLHSPIYHPLPTSLSHYNPFISFLKQHPFPIFHPAISTTLHYHPDVCVPTYYTTGRSKHCTHFNFFYICLILSFK